LYDSEVIIAGDIDGSNSQTERPSRTSAGVSQPSESESDSDIDDDTPLDEIFKKIRVKRVSGKRKAEVVSSPSPQRSHQCEGKASDDDIAAQLPRKRRKGDDNFRSDSRIFSSATMAGPRSVRDSPAQNDFHSGTEPVASTSHLDEQESSCQLSHSSSSQDSTASSGTADEPQIEDEFSGSDDEELLDDTYIPPSPVLGSYYRSFPRVITGSYRQEMS
jgi:hypothetical protein